MKPHRLLAASLLAGLLAACASAAAPDPVPRGGAAAGDSDSRRSPPADTLFDRDVAPFTVLDPEGRPYAHPFLGGLDVPRPQFVDIDGDGDFDLFVQERSDEVMFFENTGSAARPAFVWRTDRFGDLDIGEWYRFVDMDGDGDHDLLGEAPYSHIRLYRNEGSSSRPDLRLLADTLRDTGGTPIFADRQNIANAADIDCNGLMDLFLGRVDGTITRYEEAPRRGAEPRFRFVTDRFEGIEIVAQLGSLHGANAMDFADHDGDGDPDLFWGDFFEPGVLLLRNEGSCPRPNLRSEPRPLRTAGDTVILTSGYNVPALTDIDGDGDLDLFLGIIGGAFNPNRTAADNVHFYERTAAGYELRTRRYVDGIDVGSESVVTFGDVDGDGDPDMLVGNKLDPATLRRGRLYVFENEGGPRDPRFRLADTLDLAASYNYAPALADLDGDGLLDLLLGTWNDDVLFFRNEGSPARPEWVQDSTRTVRLSRGSNTTPALADVDGDGDLDLFIGEASGTLNFFRNEGSAAEPDFTLVAEDYDGIDVGRRSHPSFIDFDGDGDLDLVVGREQGGAAYFRNDGDPATPRFVRDDTVWIPLLPLASPVFVDLLGEGRADLVAGSLSGGVIYLRRR